ncbi:MAG: hypothetical protein WKF37_24645 [Bryobacteraceae bacterium]
MTLNVSKLSLALIALSALPLGAQQCPTVAPDVEHYVIDAEINPTAQTLSATAQVRFVPQDSTSAASFELNNGLNVSRIVDGGGRQIPASRNQQDFSVRLSFPDPLPKTVPSTLTFTYDGKLSGQEESPVYGIKFASIQKDHAFLLYLPAGFLASTPATVTPPRCALPCRRDKVIGSGAVQETKGAGDKVTCNFRYLSTHRPRQYRCGSG